MSNMISPMRMTGLASGLDVDSIVSKLMQSYQIKKDKMKQDETYLEWKRDAYRAITTSATTFSSTYFDQLSSDYILSPNDYADYTGISDDNTNTTSDPTRDTGVSAKGHEGAAEGKYSIVVNKVATNAANKDKLTASGSYDLSAAGSAAAANGGDTLTVVFNGKTHDFKLGNMSANDALKNIASFYNLNITSSSVDGQYHISANNSMSGSVLTLHTSGKVVNGVPANTSANTDVPVGVAGGSLGAVGNFFTNIFGLSGGALSTSGSISATSDNNQTVTLSNVNGINMLDGHNANVTITEPNGSKGSVESMSNDFLVDGVEYDISKIKLNGGTTTTNTTTTTMTQAPAATTYNGYNVTESKYTITNSDGSTTSKDLREWVDPADANHKITTTTLTNPDGTQTETEVEAKTSPSDGSVTKTTTTFAADGTQTKVTSKTINQASADPNVTKTLTADSNGNRIETVATTSGSTVTTVTTTTARDGSVTTSTDAATTNGDGSVVTNVNNTTTSFVSHTANITMSLNGDNVYKKITGFIDKYNALVKQINDAINEKKNYSYKPLTDTQKKSMTADQIKQWETVAKSGILANDSDLGSMLTDFREAFYTAVEGSGFTLTDLGIHSYGSGDAIDKAGQMQYDPDKLKTAIKKYGSSLYDIFAGTSKDQATYVQNNATNLTQDQMTANIANRKTRFSQEGIFWRLSDIVKDYTRVNDSPAGTLIQLAGSANGTDTTSDLYKQIKKSNDAIEDYDNYMSDKEEGYYQQYSKLEAYLAQAQTQQQAISSQLSKL